MVRIRLLGEVALVVGDRRIDLGPARQRCVLAALAVDVDRVVSVDVLVGRVWGDRPPQRARATLVNYLSRLRRALAPVEQVRVVRRAGGYILAAEKSIVDLHQFTALCARARACVDDRRVICLLNEAVGLWRGEALTGLDGEWAATERARLLVQYANAEHDLTDALLRAGHGEDLVARLSARTTSDPTDERVAGQYMLALYRTGRAADALGHYQLVRERLAEDLGTDPSEPLRELHQRILTADPSLAAPAGIMTTGPAIRPRQLPAPPAAFVGRHDALGRLDAVLRNATGGDGMTVAVVAGPGGIGKTWLALHWAHQNGDRFPDGQLFVNLRGFSSTDEPMSPAMAVRGFLDALGVEATKVPADLHAQAALFRSLVADRKMLFLLDDAVDAAQVAPLLPGGGTCAVVVTTRNRLSGLITGHGADQVSLDIIADGDARALLVERIGAGRVGAEPAAIAKLIAFCGGFPLALSIIAGRIRTDPHTTIAARVAELYDSGLDVLDDADPTASLPAALSFSYRALPGDQARAFVLLAIAPGPDIGLLAAASVIGLPPRETRTILRGLEQASVLSRDARGRYQMHDLIRRYGTSRAPDLGDQACEAALRRALDFYIHTAHAADCLLYAHRPPIQLDPLASGVHLPPMQDAAAALAWFDAEHPTLLAAQHTAYVHGKHLAVWRLAWGLTTFHHRRGHGRDQVVAWQVAVKAAAHLPDPSVRAYAHRLLGHALAHEGSHEDAIGYLRSALDLSEHDDDRTMQAHTHNDLAMAMARHGDHHQALSHAKLALDLYRRIGQPVWEAESLNSVGWYTAHIGDYNTARTHCQTALSISRQHQDQFSEAGALDSLGFIEHECGNHQQAVGHYTQSLALYRALDIPACTADTLSRLAQAHAALGQHDQARTTWREALDLYRAQGRDDDAENVQKQLKALDEQQLHARPRTP